jgi:DNA-binding NarL/FixJ family response regulator
MRPLRFLVVEDDESVSRALVRMLRPHGQAVAAQSVAEGIEALDAADDWAGVVLDVRLPDGDGFDVLMHAKAKSPMIPALVVTGYTDDVSVNRAYDLGAACIFKPVSGERITRFVRQRVLRSDPPAPRWQAVVDEWAVAYGLTSSEIEILQRAVSGASRDEITETRGTAESTVKKHISNLLRKTRDPSLVMAVHRVLRASTKR